MTYKKISCRRSLSLGFVVLLISVSFINAALAQAKRKIIVNEDFSGPGGSNMQTLAMLVQSPQTEVLGATVVTGDAWRDEEVAHALRLLEIMGRTDIPVVPGAVFPLVRTREKAQLWQERYGRVAYAGAWDDRWWHEPFVVPELQEGMPTTKASTEDAPHFMIRMVHKYPHEVTIYEGGPMTNLALAIAIDPQFPELAKELVFMGGGFSPNTDNPEFVNNPRHEFNFWFDPEAAEVVLRAPWKKIVCTPTDISIKTQMSRELVAKIAQRETPLTKYISSFAMFAGGANIMWDEITVAAWLDPSIVTKKETRYMGIDLDHGAGYGNTLTWSQADNARMGGRPVEVQVDLDTGKLYRMFADLMTAATPTAPASK